MKHLTPSGGLAVPRELGDECFTVWGEGEDFPFSKAKVI